LKKMIVDWDISVKVSKKKMNHTSRLEIKCIAPWEYI